MALEARSPAILRFGVFEVDVRSGELRKQGGRITLIDDKVVAAIAPLTYACKWFFILHVASLGCLPPDPNASARSELERIAWCGRALLLFLHRWTPPLT